MINPKYSYWFISILVGSLINVSLFVFLPALGRTAPPKPPQIIELDFLALQPPAEVKKEAPKVIKKPKIKPKPKPKPKPKKIVKKTKEVNKPKPKPVLSEKVIPEKIKQEIKPPVVEEVAEFIEAKPAPKTSSVSNDDVLPIPEPIFKLTRVAQFMHEHRPVYPAEMKSKHKEGTVKLKVLIDAKGKVRQVTIKKSAGVMFDLAAIEAMKLSTFQPAKIGNRSVSVLMVYPVRFRLR